MSRFKKKSFIVLVLIIGLSEAFFGLCYPRYANPISAFSPLPIMFSYDRGGRPKQTSAKVHIYTENKKYTFVANKEFYNSLKGPHHYRHIFMLKLDRAKYLLHPERIGPFLDKTICKEKIKFEQLKGERVKSVVVAFANGKEVINHGCLK